MKNNLLDYKKNQLFIPLIFLGDRMKWFSFWVAIVSSLSFSHPWSETTVSEYYQIGKVRKNTVLWWRNGTEGCEKNGTL